MSTPMSTIDQVLSQRKVLVTCGTGGVGKTTLSAAIAFRAALAGKRTVVITIDPAKRLATSLGLENLGDEPLDLTPALRRAMEKAPGVPRENMPGSLSAIMPDTRKTFERFITDIAPSPVAAERVMKNPIFQIFAKEFSGANEYMAMEKLHSLVTSGNYDCIILDTPPSRNTLEFLDAPKLLARLFEERLIRWLVLPTNKLVSGGMRKALGVLEKLTGAGFMTSLLDFAAGLFELQKGFTENLSRIVALLESPEVGFVMVTTPTPDTAPETRHFLEKLKQYRLHFDGIALNRTFSSLSLDSLGEREEARRLLTSLQNRERAILAELENNQTRLCAKLPELARDVHSVEDLLYVAMAFDAAGSF